jgi:hypothetical protein
MSRFGQRILIWSVLMSFAVFFGVELATRGLGDLEGDGSAAGTGAVEAEELLREMRREAEERAAAAAKEPALPAPPADRSPAPPEAAAEDGTGNVVEGLASAAGRLLRVTAQGSVEFVIGLLDGMLD